MKEQSADWLEAILKRYHAGDSFPAMRDLLRSFVEQAVTEALVKERETQEHFHHARVD